MEPISWTPQGGGLVEPAPTDDHPGLVHLGAGFVVFRRFDAAPVPAHDGVRPVFDLVLQGSEYYALYIEASTDRGRRQFKFIPTDDVPTLVYGYRYKAGLGSELRDGDPHRVSLDLAAVVERAEPGIVLERVDAIFIRVGSDVWIDLAPSAADQPPPPPPDADLSDTEVVRFLTQATFGAGRAAIEEVQRIGDYGVWVDAQFELPQSRTMPYVKETSNGSFRYARHYIWWANAIEGSDQLRQRLAFALSELFVVSDIDYLLGNNQYGISQFYDLLAEGASGNFRDLLEQVTLHPVMGIYLSMLRNEKADPERNVRPDENFAREVLQLFTIGLYELTADGQIRTGPDGNPLPSYDQATVENFSRVFTGWNYADTGWGDTNIPRDSMEQPMVPVEAYHDTEAKTLLSGTVLPAGQNARQDLTDALDNIFNHPNVGPFIARSLIVRLVTSNPTPAYVGRVAAVFNDNGAGERGDLAAVARAILTDAEARFGHQTMPETFGKVKEPILRLTQLWRAFDVLGGDQEGIYRPKAVMTQAIGNVVGQSPLQSPSVFNFFQPENPLVPDGDLLAPEAQILSEINVASTNNMLWEQAYTYNNRYDGGATDVSRIQIDREVAMAADPAALVDHLNVLLTGGSLPSQTLATIVAHIETHGDDDEGRYHRTIEAIACIVASPFHLVQN